jgi:hypothetical protein|tara:strand:+ start:4426 stop:4998 length:573 start_codon:yes stop_codon:yes gene_type:complete
MQKEKLEDTVKNHKSNIIQSENQSKIDSAYSIKEKLELFDFNEIYSVSVKIPSWEKEKDNMTYDKFDKCHTEKWNEWQMGREYGSDIATMLREKTGRNIIFEYGDNVIKEEIDGKSKIIDFSEEKFDFDIKQEMKNYLKKTYGNDKSHNFLSHNFLYDQPYKKFIEDFVYSKLIGKGFETRIVDMGVVIK